MIGRAAGDHVHAIDEVELLGRQVKLVDRKRAVDQASRQRVADDARLLVDLFEHEVGVAALLGNVHVPVDMRNARLEQIARFVEVPDVVGREKRELAVAQHYHVARGVDDGDDVGGDVTAVLAPADDDGAVLARHDDSVGFVGADHRQAVGTHHLAACLAHRRQQVAPIAHAAFVAVDRLLDEVREHLGVGVAGEAMPKRLELLAQFGEVLDDAVVHHRDAAVARHVRMRVGFAGTAVRRPTGVADAARSRKVEMPGGMRKAFDLAFAMKHLKVAILLDGDARRVVAAVLKALEAFDEDVFDRTRSGVADDSAHRCAPLQ